VTTGLACLVLSGPAVASADGGQIVAAGSPPLTREASDASAEMIFFMLKHVATGDAAPADLQLSQPILDGWANLLAAEYTSASPDEQQQLASMTVLRDGLIKAWPAASTDELKALRDGWRPIVQDWLASTDCDGFTSLAEAGYVEATDAYLARYRACADDGDSTDVVATPTPTAKPAQSAIPVSPTERARQASAGLQASHNMYVNMSNVLLENHVGNMNAIVNMGPSMDYHYVVTKP